MKREYNKSYGDGISKSGERDRETERKWVCV